MKLNERSVGNIIKEKWGVFVVVFLHHHRHVNVFRHRMCEPKASLGEGDMRETSSSAEETVSLDSCENREHGEDVVCIDVNVFN